MTSSQRSIGLLTFTALTVGTVLAALTAAMLAAGPARAAIPNRVDIVNFAFNPATLTVQVGDAVTWTNSDGLGHTATSDAGAPAAFDSSTIAPEGIFEFTFTTAGTYDYHCSIHASMHGTIVVEAAAASPTPAPSVPDGAVASGGSPTGLSVLVSMLLLAALLAFALVAGRGVIRS